MARSLQYIAIVFAVLMVASSCRSNPEVTLVSSSGAGEAANRTADGALDPTGADNPFANQLTGGGIDFRLTRHDIVCSEHSLNTYPDTPFLVAHVVVNGNLGAPCFGEPDERLVRAWQILAMITPPGQLHDLGVFGGFTSTETSGTTLAFVNGLADAESLYQMSINLEEADNDPDELLMTMAHEFAHVFTTGAGQLDSSVTPKQCPTWHNLRGCYRDESLMATWVETFWDGGLVDEVNRKQEPSRALGADRCLVNAGFLGPYAASHPEEDFAEAFSAFVFRVEVRSPELRSKMEWFAQQPGLMEFRNLAVEADLGPLPNTFESCG